MAVVTMWGDFKANQVDHLTMSTELQTLLKQSNINVLNFEAPIRSDGKSVKKCGPNISQSCDAPRWLEKQRFNFISLANNHMMDYGTDGLLKTIDSFQKATVLGAGKWDEAYRMHIVETAME